MKFNSKIKVFYRDDMCPPEDASSNYSKSPTKPRRFMEFLQRTPLQHHVEVSGEFEPLTRGDLLVAHTAAYVDAFLKGEGRGARSNGLAWTPEFRDSVLLTNGCLRAAITAAVDDPRQITLAPVSGFHHAQPDSGGGFCTFSGQVIAGLQLYRERGLRGVWVDLDGHFGNSIEDSRSFAPDLNEAIPVWANINPRGSHQEYLRDLRHQIDVALEHIVVGEVDYVAFAHGADSHEWDQLGHQCTTAEWLQAAKMVYTDLVVRPNVWGWSPKPVAVTMALFGGYRDDHPESVLGLHALDLKTCLQVALECRDPDVEAYCPEIRAPGS